LRLQLFKTIAVATIVLVVPIVAIAQDAKQRRVMLVLDGSSSMWTRFSDDTSKIEIAKAEIAEFVDRWGGEIDFGLTTYGHREEGNCKDIEMVMPVAAADPGQVIEATSKINPKGKTPLAAALRQAANGLDYENQPGTILLISDGIENCGQDPCQATAELAAKAKDLTIHVIGLDKNNHEMGQLGCIAANTHGRLLIDADVSKLEEAMNSSMKAVVSVKAVM